MNNQTHPTLFLSDDLSSANIGCFVKGTRITTDKGLVPIQDIQVGDMVLSKLEDGSGGPEYKPVVKTFVHTDKEIWLVKAEKIIKKFNKYDELITDYLTFDEQPKIAQFLATSNHPVWVVGMNKHSNKVIFYKQPYWKRVDELVQYEVIINAVGVMYRVDRAQPTYQFDGDNISTKDSYFWYEDNYHKDYEDDYLYSQPYRPDFEVTEEEFHSEGFVFDIEQYHQNGHPGMVIENDDEDIHLINTCTDNSGQPKPFTDNVYNFEVADNHTYYVGKAGLWVHNTNCSEKSIKITK